MEKSIHVRGEIDKLELGGAPLVVPKSEYKVSGGLTIDTGKKFRVNGDFLKA